MFEKKKLMINCEVCDARNMAQEDYAGYESILLNAEIMLVNERAKGVLAQLPVTANVEETISLPEGIDFDVRTINGSAQLGADSTVSENTILLVNGKLQLLPSAQQAIEKCYKVIVNGALRCPKSMEGCLGKINVSGATEIYPDEAVALESRFTMDRYFPLRARQDAVYWASKRIIVADEAIDVRKLAAKNVSFITQELVAPEALVEELAPLFNADAKFEVAPEGFALVPEDAVLDELLLEKYGKKLYVLGDLEIPAGSAGLLAQIDKLKVTGSVVLTKADKPALDALRAEVGSIDFVKGKIVGNAVSATIDRKLLDHAPDGVTIKNAAMINIHADITPEEILEKLDIKNAAVINCSPGQRSAVEMVTKNCAQIHSGDGDGQEGALGGILGDVIGGVKGMLGTKIVNAETHVL
ncbi:MAG: hypothetical protein IJC54_04400 [Clostridia bacterium]|nr:hypothetical protein [Clostridia bacterium]